MLYLHIFFFHSYLCSSACNTVPGICLQTTKLLLLICSRALPPPQPPEEDVPFHQDEWFHGTIDRKQVENLLKKEGDYLVRESKTQPGQFVLSTRAQGQMRHFIIQSTDVSLTFNNNNYNNNYYCYSNNSNSNSNSSSNSNRVLKWWHHKSDFSEIMRFIRLFRTTFLKKLHTQKYGSLLHYTAEIWVFEVQIASY